MKQDLTKIYDGADLSGATADVIYLPVLRDSTLESIDVLTDEAVNGDVAFSLSINGVSIAGEDLALGENESITIADGEKSVSLTGLEIELSKFDEITLNLVSGSISAPVTLNLGTDDGQSSGGGLPDGGTTGQALLKKSNADQDAEWKDLPGGGSGSGSAFFDVDAPSPTPSIYDDDFTEAELNARWTPFNLRTAVYNFADYYSHLRIFGVDNKFAGFTQNVPSGYWKFRTKVSAQSSNVEQNAGIFLTNYSDIFAVMLKQQEGSINIHFEQWSDVNSFASGEVLVTQNEFKTVYLEVERADAGNGYTTIIFRYSLNGKEFHKIKELTYGGVVGSKIGIAVRGDSVKPALFDWFRKVPDNGITGAKVGTGGGAANEHYGVDSEPDSPKPENDEFTSVDLLSKWTKVETNIESLNHNKQVRSNLIVNLLAEGNADLTLHQPFFPANNDFSVTAKFTSYGQNVYQGVGLWVIDEANNPIGNGTGSDAVRVAMYQTGLIQINAFDWKNFSGKGNSPVPNSFDGTIYLHLQRVGGIYSCSYSLNGILWTKFSSEWSNAFVVGKIRITLFNSGASTKSRHAIDWIRRDWFFN